MKKTNTVQAKDCFNPADYAMVHKDHLAALKTEADNLRHELAALRSLAPASTERVSVPREWLERWQVQLETAGHYGTAVYDTFNELTPNAVALRASASEVAALLAASGQSQDVTTKGRDAES